MLHQHSTKLPLFAYIVILTNIFRVQLKYHSSKTSYNLGEVIGGIDSSGTPVVPVVRTRHYFEYKKYD